MMADSAIFAENINSHSIGQSTTDQNHQPPLASPPPSSSSDLVDVDMDEPPTAVASTAEAESIISKTPPQYGFAEQASAVVTSSNGVHVTAPTVPESTPVPLSIPGKLVRKDKMYCSRLPGRNASTQVRAELFDSGEVHLTKSKCVLIVSIVPAGSYRLEETAGQFSLAAVGTWITLTTSPATCHKWFEAMQAVHTSDAVSSSMSDEMREIIDKRCLLSALLFRDRSLSQLLVDYHITKLTPVNCYVAELISSYEQRRFVAEERESQREFPLNATPLTSSIMHQRIARPLSDDERRRVAAMPWTALPHRSALQEEFVSMTRNIDRWAIDMPRAGVLQPLRDTEMELCCPACNSTGKSMYSSKQPCKRCAGSSTLFMRFNLHSSEVQQRVTRMLSNSALRSTRNFAEVVNAYRDTPPHMLFEIEIPPTFDLESLKSQALAAVTRSAAQQHSYVPHEQLMALLEGAINDAAKQPERADPSMRLLKQSVRIFRYSLLDITFTRNQPQPHHHHHRATGTTTADATVPTTAPTKPLPLPPGTTGTNGTAAPNGAHSAPPSSSTPASHVLSLLESRAVIVGNLNPHLHELCRTS